MKGRYTVWIFFLLIVVGCQYHEEKPLTFYSESENWRGELIIQAEDTESEKATTAFQYIGPATDIERVTIYSPISSTYDSHPVEAPVGSIQADDVLKRDYENHGFLGLLYVNDEVTFIIEWEEEKMEKIEEIRFYHEE
jgi:hypothetical protein